MPRVPDAVFAKWVDAARATPIGDVCEARHLRLRGGRVDRSGPCPDCGGENRFGVNFDKGIFKCRQCGAGGDVIALVMFLDRCDFLAACEHLTGQAPPRGEGSTLSLEELARLAEERAERRAEQDRIAAEYREQERRRLWRWWQGASHPAGTPVEAYLALRRVSLPPTALLRFSPAARLYANGKSGAAVVHEGPAMLAAIVGPDGLFVGLHTTWIDLSDPDGKARVPDDEGEFVPAKKVRGSRTGGRLELSRCEFPVLLVIGEGIETTLSLRDALIEDGRDLSRVAFWSSLDLDNLGGPHDGLVTDPVARTPSGRPRRVPGPVPAPGGIPIPDCVEGIVLLGDGDSDPFLTRNALDRAVRRWASPGRTVRVAMAPAGSDFNDLRRGLT